MPNFLVSLKKWNACFIMEIAMSVCSVIMLIWSFVTPPEGVIDASVLAGVGILFAFAALFFARETVRQGRKAKISHGQTEVTIEADEPDEE